MRQPDIILVPLNSPEQTLTFLNSSTALLVQLCCPAVLALEGLQCQYALLLWI